MSVLVPIGDFSRMTHLSVKALRFYHDQGLLEPTRIDPATGYRFYDPRQVPVAQVIRRLGRAQYQGDGETRGRPLQPYDSLIDRIRWRVRTRNAVAGRPGPVRALAVGVPAVPPLGSGWHVAADRDRAAARARPGPGAAR